MSLSDALAAVTAAMGDSVSSVRKQLTGYSSKDQLASLVSLGGGGNGGSTPDTDDQPTSVLALQPDTDSTAQPTIHQIDASRLLIQGWSAETDYSVVFVETDVVILLKPTGSANLFAAEVNGDPTGAIEPDWSSAPAVGDDVSDDSLTWYNVGPYTTWLATAPVEFAADTPYAAGTLLWPTTGNGHLYVVFPPGPFESDAEPDPWPTDGTYASGSESGYAYDMGPILAQEWSNELRAITIRDDARLTLPAVMIRVSDGGKYALAINNDNFSDPGSSQILAVDVPNSGSPAPQIRILTEGGLELNVDAPLVFAGPGLIALAADGDLDNGDWAVGATDTDFVIKKKTSAGVVKTLTIPWD